MPSTARSDTRFTAKVKVLIDKIYGRSILKDSLLERAIAFYESQPINENELSKLTQHITELNVQKEKEKVKRQIVQAERQYQDLKDDLKYESNERHKFLSTLCKEILDLTEGENFEETNRKSAQLLGTIQLLSPTSGKKVAIENERSKPLYKAVLCLRLLDKLAIDNNVLKTVPYINDLIKNIEGDKFKNLENIDKECYQYFHQKIKLPMLMALLIQDIGHYHQDAQKIVKGENGTLDPFRTLTVEERKSLLQINYRETLKFLIEGVGSPIYIGNSKVDREKFYVEEHNKLVFVKHLLKRAISPQQGIGNLLKVPQIYASIILSTKSSYNYKLLPKVYQALNKNAEKGVCSQIVVDALRVITGDYPQGFGITYIPKDSDGKEGDHYEYAIVNQLYPVKVEYPRCRIATRSLRFIGYGQDIEIPLAANLYHTETAKRFSSISKARLNEILELLSSNYLERKDLDLLPRCWNAGDFFSMKSHQKLWNKTQLINN